MSYCIIVRWVGLSALSFFLRWISSIFHGGISEWLVTAVDNGDGDAIVLYLFTPVPLLSNSKFDFNYTKQTVLIDQ